MKISCINSQYSFKSQARYEITDKNLTKDSLKKLMNSFQYLDIAYCPKTGQFGILEYIFKKGKKSDLTDKYIDGITEKNLSDNAFLQTFLDKGYDVNKIIYNNKPARNIFQRNIH